jgi:hypothetical protein
MQNLLILNSKNNLVSLNVVNISFIVSYDFFMGFLFYSC